MFQEIYEIYHNGQHFCAQEVIRHETGSNVVMNFAVRSDGRRSFLCAGQESHCQMYFVNPRVISEDGKEEVSATQEDKPHKTNVNDVYANENGIRQRRQTGPSGVEELPNGHVGPGETDAKPQGKQDQNANLKRILKFDIKAADSVQTDFLSADPLQRVVRISPNGRVMATGGTDGYLRVWSFPQMMKNAEIE